MPITPPPIEKTVSLVHKITLLYQDLYRLGKSLPKRDHFGIHATAEKLLLDMLELAIQAAYAPKETKTGMLARLRITIEMEKHIVRTMREMHIIENTAYMKLSVSLVELSKMTNGWLKYAEGAA